MPRKLNEQKFCGWCGAKVDYKSDWMSECPNCGYKHYDNPRTCCNLVISKGDDVLLLQRSIEPNKGKFDLPGGFMDINDDSIEAATYRELKEELGLDKNKVSTIQYLGSGTETYLWQDSELPLACFYFSCTLNVDADEVVVDQKENSQLRWISQDDLNNTELAWPLDKKMLTKYFKEKNG
jgi:NADH pyrophosphatase NudC (nudix superfamily)